MNLLNDKELYEEFIGYYINTLSSQFKNLNLDIECIIIDEVYKLLFGKDIEINIKLDDWKNNKNYFYNIFKNKIIDATRVTGERNNVTPKTYMEELKSQLKNKEFELLEEYLINVEQINSSLTEEIINRIPFKKRKVKIEAYLFFSLKVYAGLSYKHINAIFPINRFTFHKYISCTKQAAYEALKEIDYQKVNEIENCITGSQYQTTLIREFASELRGF